MCNSACNGAGARMSLKHPYQRIGPTDIGADELVP